MPTSNDRELSDNQVHDLLVAAREALGDAPGETVRGDTALKAARRAMNLLQFGLIAAAEQEQDHIDCIIPEKPDE